MRCILYNTAATNNIFLTFSGAIANLLQRRRWLVSVLLTVIYQVAKHMFQLLLDTLFASVKSFLVLLFFAFFGMLCRFQILFAIISTLE